jgi:hypothetical protein
LSSQIIRVEFFDVASQKVFAVSEMPPDRLPETFQLNTVMHIGENDWQVIKAEPITAQEFKATGKLRLSLSKVAYMNPKDILYSLPSISDWIPPSVSSSMTNTNRFELHEDDWQQIELISASQKTLILSELDGIRSIFQNHRVGQGFNKMHIRQSIKKAILSPLSLKAVHASFPNKEIFETVHYLRSQERISDAFAFKVSPFVVYGYVQSDVVIVLGLHFISHPKGISGDTLGKLAEMMKVNNLVLVDWVHIQLISPTKEELQTYFQSFS